MLKLSHSEVKFFRVLNFLYNKYSSFSEVTYLIAFLAIFTVRTLSKMKKCLLGRPNRNFEGSCTRLELFYLSYQIKEYVLQKR
jgi:hypothetical protein